MTGNPNTQPTELHPPGDYTSLEWINPFARSTVRSRLTVTFFFNAGFCRYIRVQVCTGQVTWLTTNPHTRPKSTIFNVRCTRVKELNSTLDKGECHIDDLRCRYAVRIGGTDNLIRTSILARHFCRDLRSDLQRKLLHTFFGK